MSHWSNPRWVPRCRKRIWASPERGPNCAGRMGTGKHGGTTSACPPKPYAKAGVVLDGIEPVPPVREGGSGAPRTMPAHPRSGKISGVRLRRLVCHRARSARSTRCLSIAPAGWFFSTVSLERCALRLVATQSRGDGNGFKLRTICCGLAVLVRIVALRATRSAEENGKQPTSN